MIKAGELKHIIKVKVNVEVITATGERLRDFETKVFHVRAAVRYLTGKERLAANKETVTRTMVFKIRYMKEIDNFSIIEYLNKDYEVIEIENVKNMNKSLIITGVMSE